jgi:hypothetical protein
MAELSVHSFDVFTAVARFLVENQGHPASSAILDNCQSVLRQIIASLWHMAFREMDVARVCAALYAFLRFDLSFLEVVREKFLAVTGGKKNDVELFGRFAAEVQKALDDVRPTGLSYAISVLRNHGEICRGRLTFV